MVRYNEYEAAVNSDGYDVAIVGLPYDAATTGRSGTKEGPSAIRRASYMTNYPHYSMVGGKPQRIDDRISVCDLGDMELPPTVGHDLLMVDIEREIRNNVLSYDTVPIALGGDHSLLLPLVSAAAQVHGPVTLLHIDAHSDTWDDYYHGTRFVDHGTAVRDLIEGKCLTTARQMGVRGYAHDMSLYEWCRSSKVYWYPPSLRHGVESYVDLVLDGTSGPYYLTTDIDALDPAYAPGTGTPEPGGFTTAELLLLVYTLLRRVQIVGADIMEVSPPYDHAGITAMAAHRYVAEVIGGINHHKPRTVRIPRRK